MASLKQVSFAQSLGIMATRATPSAVLKHQISDAIRSRERNNEQVIEDVKARANLLDYVRVPLQRVGQVQQGCCPFHVERTPSFTVYDDGSWYCFGACREGGDVFSFLMKQYNLSFADALAELARDTGVRLGGTERGKAALIPVEPVKTQQRQDKPRGRKWRDPTWQAHARREANEAHDRLMNWNNGYVEGAAMYLASRGLDRETWREFRFGQLVSTRWCGKSKKRVAVGNAISIPWFGPDGTTKAINHRIISGKQRFNQKAGSWRGLYGAHLIEPSKSKILVAVEGEFNCASIRQVARVQSISIDCVSFGSQSSSEFTMSALSHLRGKYNALVVWADKPEAVKSFESDLALSSAAGDANDLLKSGWLGGLLKRVCMTLIESESEPEPEPEPESEPEMTFDEALAAKDVDAASIIVQQMGRGPQRRQALRRMVALKKELARCPKN